VWYPENEATGRCAGGQEALLIHVSWQAYIGWLLFRHPLSLNPFEVLVRAELDVDNRLRGFCIGPVRSSSERFPQVVLGTEARLDLPRPVRQPIIRETATWSQGVWRS
jgi:hypothetical protein